MNLEALTLEELKARRPDLVDLLQLEGTKAATDRLRDALRQCRTLEQHAEKAFAFVNGKLRDA